MSTSFCKTACMVAGLMAFPLLATAARTADPTAEALREQNRQNLSNVRTIVLEERVELRRTVPLEARRAQEVTAIEDARNFSVRRAVAAGESEERIQQIHDQMDGRYESVEDSLLIEKLNAMSAVRRTTTIDRVLQRIRRDDDDLRDLTKLAKEHRLGQGQLTSLDRTCSLISLAGKPEVQLHTPRVGKLATTNRRPQVSFSREESQLGALPERLFSEDYSLEVRTADAKQFRIIGMNKASGLRVYEATVDSERGNAMTELRIFDSGGDLIEIFTASDFRRVDGVWLPFETRTEYPAEPIAPTVIERHVRSARINPTISDALFAPPSDYRVVDLTGTATTKQPGAKPR